MWVWYYDRQGVIQSNGIDFVKDLPRFLVLLLALQRFELVDWSVITGLNPGAKRAHTAEFDLLRSRAAKERNQYYEERQKEVSTCTLKNEDFDSDSIGGLDLRDFEKIDINLKDWLSHKPHSLGGRATAVLGASDPRVQDMLACKILFPEVARENEGKIIDDLRRDIEGGKMPHLSKHLPEVQIYGDMSRYGTQRIRNLLKLSIEGYRTLRVLVSRKLAPLTSVAGEEFVKAWLEVMRCAYIIILFRYRLRPFSMRSPHIPLDS